MANVRVSTVNEVLEQLRQDVVAQLQSHKVRVPQPALEAGGWEPAVVAWVRLQDRSVAAVPRAVHSSRELQSRRLEPETAAALAAIRAEFERGGDLTHRLTRYFYKAGFNDFLFNTFGIHHMHLGALGAAKDSTKQHVMAGGADEILLVIIRRNEAHFLDVLSHDVFDDATMTKSLVQIAQRNWPAVLEGYVIPVQNPDLSFETAFEMAKKGFTVPFEVDGVVFASGNVLDGTVRKIKGPNGEDAGYERSACTSTGVIRRAQYVLNAVVELVTAITHDADRLADQLERQLSTRPTDFQLQVVEFGSAVILRDNVTGSEFRGDGRSYHFVLPSGGAPSVNARG